MDHKVSAIVNTYNEEKYIRNALESIKWVDEIILVDMYSNDKTVEISKEYTDKIYYFEYKGHPEPAKQFALDKVSNEWVIVLDADEMIPLNLKNKLYELMKSNKFDMISIPHKNYFFGEISTDNKNNYHLRFFKKANVTFGKGIHGKGTHYKKDSKVYRIKDGNLAIIHFAEDNFMDLFEKLDRYTTIEVQNMNEGIKDYDFIQFINIIKRIIYFTYLYIGLYTQLLSKRKTITLYRHAFGMYYDSSILLKRRLNDKYNTLDYSNCILKDHGKIANEIISEYNKYKY
ncbi:MAG: glycosyltransferase family 2 protein [Methanobrevibacter sp.]|jgi:glycosyltransferase involved in cell wall biosynthesis|nr:glycosyltransferase family 2 protein [Methanobrevibacter sp.]